MYVYLSKLLPLLVLPVGIIIILSVFALMLLWMGRRKSALVLMSVALSLLCICSMPITAGNLYGRLEQVHPPVSLDNIPVRICAIVLGGAVGSAVAPRVDIELNEAVDRVYKAAQLYRAGKVQTIIVAAGNQPWDASLMPEALQIQKLLIEWGVPQWVISLDGASRNTRENAVNSKEALEQIGCDSPLLVTSAAHMPRAVAAFSKVGVDVFPVSTDVRVLSGTGVSVFDFLPQAGALAMTTDAIREWMGQKVYEFRDWN